MALSLKSERVDRLARELSALTGETITDAILGSIEMRLDLERKRRRAIPLDDIVERCSQLPILDKRGADEILGFDDHGLPA